MPQSNNGKIAVRPHQGTIKTSQLDKLMGYGSTYLHSEASRSTEDDALEGLGPIPVLNELQREIALLERIGRDPQNYALDYPVRERPYRPIFGSALWAWIGHQPGITLRAREVRQHLDAISKIEERRAEMNAVYAKIDTNIEDKVMDVEPTLALIPENCNRIIVGRDFRGEPREPIYFIGMYEGSHPLGAMKNMTLAEMKAFVPQLNGWNKSLVQPLNSFISELLEYKCSTKGLEEI